MFAEIIDQKQTDYLTHKDTVYSFFIVLHMNLYVKLNFNIVYLTPSLTDITIG